MIFVFSKFAIAIKLSFTLQMKEKRSNSSQVKSNEVFDLKKISPFNTT